MIANQPYSANKNLHNRKAVTAAKATEEPEEEEAAEEVFQEPIIPIINQNPQV